MRIRWYGPSLILFVTVACSLWFAPDIARRVIWSQTQTQITQVRSELADQPSLAELSDSFSKVSLAVEPSVVHVQIRAASARRGGGWFSRLDPLDIVGNGSGWVYHYQPNPNDPGKNYVISNHHVVAQAQRVIVRFNDGSEDTATLVGSDPLTDVAVLRVDNSELLHPAELNLTPVRKGQLVFAFGSPFRFDFSVSQGIVSATGRQLSLANNGKYEDFIQTDAAINPGNSGGPLTDIYGRVVGMNTAIASSNADDPNNPGGFMGLGFAIPVAMAVQVAERLIEDGQVRRGYLGVYIENLTPDMAESLGVPPQGVLIEHPLVGSPAETSGLKPADVVTRIGETDIHDVDQLRYTIATYRPGSSVEIQVLRDAKPLSLTVKLGELGQRNGMPEAAGSFNFRPTRVQDHPALQAFGIEHIADFSTDAMNLHDRRPVEGAAIVGVRPGSNAEQQNVLHGAIITRINQTPTPDTATLLALLADRDTPVTLRITMLRWDDNAGQFVHSFALMKRPR